MSALTIFARLAAYDLACRTRWDEAGLLEFLSAEALIEIEAAQSDLLSIKDYVRNDGGLMSPDQVLFFGREDTFTNIAQWRLIGEMAVQLLIRIERITRLHN